MELSAQFLKLYYAATAVFLLLDIVFGINVRVAFLEPWPGWRITYYLVCFALLAVIAWRPKLAGLVGVAESLLTLTALIVTMALRVMVVTDEMIDGDATLVTAQEIINFLLSGGIAWFYWQRGVRALLDAGHDGQSGRL
ncbi:MAG: hypothetical protein AAF660_05535 [Pseudomonadota bacterium]